ncbi:MAG: RNA-binding protein [Bacteroidia bacterium]|nr:RNA-binding protein [Bacteroidia bacterium]
MSLKAVYVGNISYRLNEDDLKHEFSKYGSVQAVKIITDEYSGRSKGFGFVYLKNDGEIDDVIKALNGKELKGQSIRVNRALIRNKI